MSASSLIGILFLAVLALVLIVAGIAKVRTMHQDGTGVMAGGLLCMGLLFLGLLALKLGGLYHGMDL